MLPSNKEWENIISNLGINNSDHVIIYDNSDVFSSCRVWYSFIYFGHDPDHVSVLDGNFTKWLREKRAVSKEITKIQETNYKAVVGKLEVNNSNTMEKRILYPEIRIYDNPQTLTYEASIQTSFLGDHYLTMSNIDRSEYYNIKFQHKPLMIWIWISVLLLSFGGFLSLFKNAKNN